MNEKDLDVLIGKVKDQVKDAVKTEVEAATAGTVTLKELDEKLETAGITEEAIKAINDAIEGQGVELKKFFDEKNASSVKSNEQIIDEKADEIADLAGKNNGGVVKLELGSKTQVTRASVADSTMAMRLPGVGQLPYQGTVMSGLFRHAGVSPSSNGVIRYFDQNAVTRNADTVAEGGVKPESAITWIERTLNLVKIADSIPVTMEAFKDVEFIKSEIDRLLNINLALKEDQQLWDGDGIDPNLIGLITSAPTFNAGAYAGTQTTQANLFDLLAILRVEISNNKQSKYMPNVVVMNPVDVLRYKLAKGTDGHYVLPPFVTESGARIDQMSVVESSQVTPNTLAIGDFRYGTIYDMDGVTVSMGWVNDQFVRNAVTILAEKREGLLIRNVDVDAFLFIDDIDAAIVAISV